jgi:hypothetical protein
MMRTVLAAAVTVLLAGAAHAATTEFIIFKQPNFQGASQKVKGQVDNLEGGFARQGSSLIVRGGYWEVCNRDHFKGDCFVLGPGEYPRLSPALNDRIVAVRFLGADSKHARREAREERREAKEERREDRREAREERREARREARQQGAIDLYGRPDFRGRAVRVEDNMPTLREFDGRASSVVVHDGRWQLCSEPGFEGRCEVFEPGRYPRLASLNDRVSSLRQVR